LNDKNGANTAPFLLVKNIVFNFLMQIASEYIALLQDAVDPENTIEEEALLLADGRSFGVCYP